jgi:branched-chain amino acid transport system ATP-binding protein
MTTMLEISNLGVRYGHHLALENVSAKVDKGEICVILGANGAGKSSLLKAIAGMVKAEDGTRVVMNGKVITGTKPHKIVEEGIALVPEGRGIFGDLTVAENLQLGAFARRARNQEAATLRHIYELFPRLSERKSQVVRTMSGGEQQMVAIGRALMSKPEILMLDEPSLGLSPLLTKDLFKSLGAIAATGVGILLVEQNAKQSLKIADRGYLIENGLITGENTAAALAEDPAVINAYLGGATEAKRTASRTIRLPAPFALPSTLEAMGRFMGELAARASAIHAAFVRYVRREAPVPSAFVGRHDPRAGGDPFEEIAATPQMITQRSRPMVSSDARNLSTDAGRLAQAARASSSIAELEDGAGGGSTPHMSSVSQTWLRVVVWR